MENCPCCPCLQKRGSLYIDQLQTNCFNIHCCKKLESLVCDEQRNHLLTNDLMFENQHGFSPGKSCATALCEATTELLAALDRRSSPTARIDLVSVDYTAHLTQFRTMFLSVNFTKPTEFVHRYCNGLHPSLQVVANVLWFVVLVLIGQMSYLVCPRAPF